jgi:hypothetical protein
MTEDARPRSADDSPRPPTPAGDPFLSPSLDRGTGAEESAAYELKFLIAEATAARIGAWAATHLAPDVHGDADGGYRTTTLYLDGADWPVLRRAEGVGGRKHRVRRYGDEATLYLERKRRRGDRVRKLRVAIPEADAARLERADSDASWAGAWFLREIAARGLKPACRLSYRRLAFFGAGEAGPVRLTLDRRVVGVRDATWGVEPVREGRDVLDGRTVCELKFRDALPELFRRLIADFELAPAGVSKYRRFMESIGVFGAGDPRA